ncbi:protein of unknown function [uncultured Woeseiaceae bacterium]|uniref:Uncharacterized protein n=1 Tax=uncultured Woeseiaceae bacterium TaxID=1983305 RepID=A0A7D9H4I6_9GAMM|nr:protein of unknown function [uncultured Woeseiaceae bacterium]
MKSKKINNWLTLIANFGVVIGLALLIYELRQSQNLAEMDAAVRRLDQMQIAQLEFATSEFLVPARIKALSEGVDSLSAVELQRLRSWENTVRLRMLSQYIQYLRGYLDQETADRMINTAVAMLPFWEELGYELDDRTEFERAIRRAAGR